MCETDIDCSLKGLCTNRQCSCDPAWTGDHCQLLNLLPASLSAGPGFHGPGTGHDGTSSWGGSVVHQGDTWHMFASEFVGGCGLSSWGGNSQIVHAVSNALFHWFPHFGGHAFSVDGQRWSNITYAYNGTINLDNGDNITCGRRERPALIFDQSGLPTHLVTGCCVAPCNMSGAGAAAGEDYSFTSVQPIATNVATHTINK